MHRTFRCCPRQAANTSAEDEIIDKAMAKDLEQRYASGAEFAQDLRKLLATMG